MSCWPQWVAEVGWAKLVPLPPHRDRQTDRHLRKAQPHSPTTYTKSPSLTPCVHTSRETQKIALVANTQRHPWPLHQVGPSLLSSLTKPVPRFTSAGCLWIKMLGVEAGNNLGWPRLMPWAGISFRGKNFSHPWRISHWIQLLLHPYLYWNSLWSWASEEEILLDSSSI